jgi:hypothetical protein
MSTSPCLQNPSNDPCSVSPTSVWYIWMLSFPICSRALPVRSGSWDPEDGTYRAVLGKISYTTVARHTRGSRSDSRHSQHIILFSITSREFFLRVKSGRRMKVFTHLHLVPRFIIRFRDVIIKSMSDYTFHFDPCHGTQSCPLAIFGFTGPETLTFIAEGHSVPE